MISLAKGFLEKSPNRDKSFFSFVVAPEYLTSEMLLSLVYRQLGFSDFVATSADRFIPFLSRDLKKVITTSTNFSTEPFDSNEIRMLLENVVSVPKELSQRDKYKDLLFFYPLTPYAALFSHPVKLKSPKGDPTTQTGSSPWNPASIFKQMFMYSTKDDSDRTELWNELFEALCVQDENEDFFAKVVDGILEKYTEINELTYGKTLKWSAITNPFESSLENELMSWDDRSKINCSPYKVFAEDLRNLLKLKQQFSRRQWLTLLEAYLRISMAAFVAWTIHMHLQVYNVLLEVIKDQSVIPTLEQLYEKLSLSTNSEHSLFSYGELFAKNKQALVTQFGPAFYYIDFLLFVLKEKFSYIPDWTTVQGFYDSLSKIAEIFKDETYRQDFNTAFGTILEEKSAILKQKRTGKIKHLDEFFSLLRQRSVADSKYSHYDQSYLAKRRSAYKNSPYVLIPGSAQLLTLAFCCVQRSRTVVTLEAFREYLLHFGFSIKQSQIEAFTLQLRNLGLTMDSPDAEEGAIILPPFTMERGE